MKIVSFSGGLGNQIFEFLFYCFLKRKCPTESFYGYYGKRGLGSHNGLEIDKWFDVELPKSSAISNILVFFCRLLSKFGFSLKFSESNFRLNGIFYDGWWQSKKFYEGMVPLLDFRKLKLSTQNEDVLRRIDECCSVSIHIRRGDYLSPQYKSIYGNVCTIEYYQKAINIILEETEYPIFFIFSNDIEWVKSNFILKNAVFIDWNTKEDSFYDMYLMSHCQHHIIANSSFSFWGAMLQNKKNGINVYPKKWYNAVYDAPDIFPASWLGI